MANFDYQALSPDGSVENGRMDAESEDEVESRLRALGQYLIEAEARTPDEEDRPKSDREVTDARIPNRDLMSFTEYLWGSLQAGVPILSTLHDMEVQLTHKKLQKITAEIRIAMTEEGKSLSEALMEHPKAFPELYVGTVEAGEITGKLDYALEQLVNFLEWRQEITLQLRQVTLYPIILLLFLLGLVVVLVVFVYPRLFPVFNSFDMELPLPTQIVFTTGNFLRDNWLWLVGGAVALPISYKIFRLSEAGRLTTDTIKLRIPIVGPLIHQIEMARCATYLALFYRTGIDLLRGLDLLEKMTANRRIARAIGTARDSVYHGESLTHAFAATKLFPPVIIRGFALGESTGKLDETLDRARAYYAREVPAAVRRMLATLQPLMILFLGGLLLIVALSIFLPILGIYESVGT